MYPSAGSLTEETDLVTVRPDANGLAPGLYMCDLSISDANERVPTQTVRVLLLLSVHSDCFPPEHPDYDTWVSVGQPACWCNPRQCHGDTDGLMEGGPKTGYFYVHFHDLDTLIAGWPIAEPPMGPGISTVLGPEGVPAICADFDHDIEGCAKSGYFRVKFWDLNILFDSWNIAEPPHGPGLPADCLNLE